MKKGEGIASRKDRKKKRRDLAAYLLADIQRELAHSHSDDKASCIQALLNASKLIMRHEKVAKESLCQVQTGCRYDEEPRQESEPVFENASPDPRAEGRTCSDDGYA